MLQEHPKGTRMKFPNREEEIQASVTQMAHWPWGINVLVAVYEFGNKLRSL